MDDRRKDIEAIAADRRAHPRKKVLWMAELRDEAGTTAWGVVLDISQGGGRVRLDAQSPSPDWPADTGLQMAIPGRAELPAAVVWREANVLGLRFLVPPEEAARQLGSVLG